MFSVERVLFYNSDLTSKKFKLSAAPLKSLQVLREIIVAQYRLITSEILQNVIKAFQNRLYCLMEVENSIN